MLLSRMFISSYTTIYFFVKKFIFSIVYNSVNTIFECPYMFFGLERGHQLRTYVTGGGMGRVIQNAYKWVQGGDGCHVSCIRTHLHYLVSCFWQQFCRIALIVALPLFKKEVFVRNGYFSPSRSISVVMK